MLKKVNKYVSIKTSDNMSVQRGQFSELIQTLQNLMDEYSISAKHDYEYRPGHFSDLVFFKNERMLVALNYFQSSVGAFPKDSDFNPGANKDLSGMLFDYWALYDGHYFHLMQVNVLIGFAQHIIPFKTFLFRISQDDVLD